MIVRPSVHWLRMLFVWRGSILPVILPQLITITLLAIFIYHIHGSILSWKVSLNFVPFSLIGLTLEHRAQGFVTRHQAGERLLQRWQAQHAT